MGLFQRSIPIMWLLCATLFPTAAVPAPLQGGVQKEDTTPLTGDVFEDEQFEMPKGISFSAKVDECGPEYKPKKLFSGIQLPEEDSEDNWYQIPKWRAGLFHRETQTDHSIFGDVTITSRVDHLYGMQIDKKGGIWHHVSWPRITKVAMEGYTEYKIINKYEPIKLDSEQYCVKTCSTDIDVDDKTGKIIRVGKQEEFDTYFPAGPGVARGACIKQGFSQYGRPNTQVERTSVEEERIQPFQVLNKFRGKDLRESFKRFLQSHGREDLIPED